MDAEEEKYRHKVKVKSRHYIGDTDRIYEWYCQDCPKNRLVKGGSRRETLKFAMMHWEAKHGGTVVPAEPEGHGVPGDRREHLPAPPGAVEARDHLGVQPPQAKEDW